jgi:hypothetical protein
MKTKVILSLVTGLLGVSLADAQFDFLKHAVDAVKGTPAAPASSTTDTLTAAGQMLRGAAGIGPEEEKVVGDSVALEIVGRYGGLVRDAAVLHRVNLIGRGLARYSERPELTGASGC